MLSDNMLRAIESLPGILSIREAADFFQVSYLTIYRYVNKGIIPAYKDDEGNWCIARPDLKQYCSKHCNL
jgi:excisionase family DNA binding protein